VAQTQDQGFKKDHGIGQVQSKQGRRKTTPWVMAGEKQGQEE